MKAVVFKSIGEIALESVKEPELQKSMEIIIRIKILTKEIKIGELVVSLFLMSTLKY